MIGSTNHLELLDPGISKRPSRFDRKYLFPNPNFDQRVKYAQFWRHKLLGDKSSEVESIIHRDIAEVLDDDTKIEFPEEMCQAVAKITDKFSFAYIQEAFVAALLALVVDGDDDHDDAESDGFILLKSRPDLDKAGDDDLEGNVLWQEFKKQVKVLRDQLDDSETTND